MSEFEAAVMDLAALDLERVDRELDHSGYMIIRDAGIAAVCPSARTEYEQFLLSSVVHAPRHSFDFRSLTERPWRKLAIGSRIGLGHPYAQNLQSTYFDAGDRHFPQLSRLFQMMLRVRNQLMRVRPDFGSDPEKDRFWNACRIHHYPRGGGFMAMHKDTHFPQLIESQLGKPFYQVAVLLSQKNEHFNSGGGFVVDGSGKKIDLEDEGGFGALVLFDGRTSHGVDDVDLDQVIDFSRADGRIAAFVNLYAVL